MPLDGAELTLDKLETLVLAFKLVAQAFGKRLAFSGRFSRASTTGL